MQNSSSALGGGATATAPGSSKSNKQLAKEEKAKARAEAKAEKEKAKAEAKAEKARAKAEAKVEKEKEKEKAQLANDKYTAEILRNKYNTFRAYYLSELADQAELKTRMPNMPEHVSENIVKFIIRNHLGVESYWAKHVEKPGDLWSPTEKVQECKCFMSSGPSSFGPEKVWDVAYFLDLRNWVTDEIVLYRTTLSPRDEAWQNIRMSTESKKKEGGELWRDQCTTRGARPHIGWEALYPQIREHCTEVYRGSFEGIFSKGTNL